MFQAAISSDGVMATPPRNSAPGQVIRLRMWARYRSVGCPGLIPGIYPPCFRMMSAC